MYLRLSMVFVKFHRNLMSNDKCMMFVRMNLLYGRQVYRYVPNVPWREASFSGIVTCLYSKFYVLSQQRSLVAPDGA